MPTYTFRNVETSEEQDVFLKMSELDNFREKNPQLQSVITAPALVTGVQNFNAKVPDWHKDNMKEMKKIHPKGDYGAID